MSHVSVPVFGLQQVRPLLLHLTVQLIVSHCVF